MADFLARAGIEVVPYAYKHHASLYVDFVGARPAGIEVLALHLVARGTRAMRPNVDLATDNWLAAACLVISHVLRLKPVLLTIDPGMLAVVKSAMGVASSDVPVVLSGEIGTGKYNIARLINSASRRGGGLFTIQCAALEEVDSDGLSSFWSASIAGNGAQTRGQGGTVLFLDEIGELTDCAQLKLLQILQAERTPWVETHTPWDTVRFIAATNRPLATMVERGDFRRELYWRLNVFNLNIPPLRERANDIPMLARYFLRRANPKREFTPMALKALGGHAFPGNVFELQNLVTRLAIAPLQAGNSLIDMADVRHHLIAAPDRGETSASGWKNSREEARREMVLKTIAAAGGNRAEAARRLGITPRALQYHITKAGLSRRRSVGTNGFLAAPALCDPPRTQERM